LREALASVIDAEIESREIPLNTILGRQTARTGQINQRWPVERSGHLFLAFSLNGIIERLTHTERYSVVTRALAFLREFASPEKKSRHLEPFKSFSALATPIRIRTVNFVPVPFVLI
jgi:hypothetical protein